LINPFKPRVSKWINQFDVVKFKFS